MKLKKPFLWTFIFSHTHTPPLLSSSFFLFTCHSNCSFNYSVIFESLTLLSVLRQGCFSQEAPGVLNVCCLQQKLQNFGFLIFLSCDSDAFSWPTVTTLCCLLTKMRHWFNKAEPLTYFCSA